MDRVRYLTKGLLCDLNNQAIELKLENHLSRGTVSRLPAGMRFPVVDHFLQADSSVRLEVGLSITGRTGFIDISVEEFAKLPELECHITPELIDALDELSKSAGMGTIH